MKNIIRIVVLLIVALALCSCFDSNGDSPGNLKIVNNTNAPITIIWDDNSQAIVGENASMVFHFYDKSAITDAKSFSKTYTCKGLYLHEISLTDVVSIGNTTIRTLNPDSGGIKFINHTAGQLTIEAPGLPGPVLIDSLGSSSESFQLSGASNSVTISIRGDFVFIYHLDMNVFLNATSTFQIEPTAAAIKVINNSDTDILEVFLKPHSEIPWGENDLQVTIPPGDFETWAAIPNTYDVKVVDLLGHSSTWENNSFIDINQMLIVHYPSVKQH